MCMGRGGEGRGGAHRSLSLKSEEGATGDLHEIIADLNSYRKAEAPAGPLPDLDSNPDVPPLCGASTLPKSHRDRTTARNGELEPKN